MDIVRMELSVDLYTRLLAHVPSTSRLADRLRATLKVERVLPAPETYYWFMGSESDAFGSGGGARCRRPVRAPPAPRLAATRQAEHHRDETGLTLLAGSRSMSDRLFPSGATLAREVSP